MNTEFALSQIDPAIHTWPGGATHTTGTSAQWRLRKAAAVNDQATSQLIEPAVSAAKEIGTILSATEKVSGRELYTGPRIRYRGRLPQARGH
jgi:hypothetical protein